MKKTVLALFLWLALVNVAHAACTFVNSGAKGEADSANITLGAPASPQNNDVWIAAVNTRPADHTFTDWTEIVQADPWGNQTYSIWYHRYAGVTPNLVVSATYTGAGVGGIAAFRGCDQDASPVDTLGTATASANDNTPSFASITPATSNTLVLAVWFYSDDLAVSAGPTDFTEAFAYLTTLALDGGVYLYYKAHASGATGALGATMTAQTSDDETTALLLALAAAAGGVVQIGNQPQSIN